MKTIRLTRIRAGYYMYTRDNREYLIERDAADRTRWNVDCYVNGHLDWQDCTWGGLSSVRDAIRLDIR